MLGEKFSYLQTSVARIYEVNTLCQCNQYWAISDCKMGNICQQQSRFWRNFISEKEIELRLQQMKFFGIPAVADAGAPHLIWPIQPGSKIHIFLRNKIGKWTGGDLI